jgi:hypothetical protein
MSIYLQPTEIFRYLEFVYDLHCGIESLNLGLF